MLFKGPCRPVQLTQRLARSASSIRAVAPSTDRHLALPLAFVAVKGWEPRGTQGWEDWISRFAARGYSSLVLEVDPAAAPSPNLDGLESELVRLLRDRSAASPFPPLLFAHSASSLLAEQYVSSHPLSGLCLVDPVNRSSAHQLFPHFFPAPVDDFNYEPGFPIAVVESQAKDAFYEHWLVKEFGPQEGFEDDLDAPVRRLSGERDAAGWQKMMDWMDENSL